MSLARTMQCGIQCFHHLQVQTAVPGPTLPLLRQTRPTLTPSVRLHLNLTWQLATRSLSSSAHPLSSASSTEQGHKQELAYSKAEASTSNDAQNQSQSGASATASSTDASSANQNSLAHDSIGSHANDSNSAIAPSEAKPAAAEKAQGASAIKGRRPTFDELMATMKPELKAMCIAEGLRSSKRTKAQLSKSLVDKWDPPPSTRQKRKEYKKTRKKAKNEKKKLQAAAGNQSRQAELPASKPKALEHDSFWDG